MFEKKITKNQKILLVVVLAVVVLLVIWFVYDKYENLSGENAVITNKPNNNQDATELKEKDPVIHPRVYDRISGQITDASEFVGLPEKIYPANGGNSVSNYGRKLGPVASGLAVGLGQPELLPAIGAATAMAGAAGHASHLLNDRANYLEKRVPKKPGNNGPIFQ